MKKKHVISLAVIALLAAACLVYARPMTVEQRFSNVDLDGLHTIVLCTKVGPEQAYMIQFRQGDEAFDSLIADLRTRTFRHSLQELIPTFSGGARFHGWAQGEFDWQLYLCSGPEGGVVLSIYDFGGALSLSTVGDRAPIPIAKTGRQKDWETWVLSLSGDGREPVTGKGWTIHGTGYTLDP